MTPLKVDGSRIVVVGLGPAGVELLTAAARDAIERVRVRFVRTTRHPAAVAVEHATSFDYVYEEAATLDEVYDTIVELLMRAAREHGEVLYAVPGSPAVAERTVELLLDGSGDANDDDVAVEVIPAMSFLDLAWVRLGVDPVQRGVRVVDGHRFASEAAGERGPILVAQCDSRAVMSDVKLAFEDGAPAEVTVLQRLGSSDERVTTIEWADLDRSVEPDHLTCLWIPELADPVNAALADFVDVVRTLREQCPWDREQTHATLARYAIEEAYEVVDAIESGDASHLKDELGDLLLQVVLHATIAAQAGDFTLADVARTVTEKMIRRHPHVFGDVDVSGADDVRKNWEQIKQDERDDSGSALDGIPGSLPALTYAAKLGKRAASVGFDWAELRPVYEKVAEELDELRADGSAEELGDVLFAVVNVARHLRHDPESALRAASAKFKRRFHEIERLAAERGIDLAGADLAQLDVLWEEAKALLAASTAP